MVFPAPGGASITRNLDSLSASTTDGITEVEQIEPEEVAIAPDDDVQNLITRG